MKVCLKLVLIKPQSYKQTKKYLNVFCCKLLCKCGLRLALLLTFYYFIYNLISNRLLYAYYFVNMIAPSGGKTGDRENCWVACWRTNLLAPQLNLMVYIDGHSLNQVSGAILDGVKLICTYSLVTKIDLSH